MKHCNSCHKDKVEDMFYSCLSIKGKVIGLQDICKVCEDGFDLPHYFMYLNVRVGMWHLFVTSYGINFYCNDFHKNHGDGRFCLYTLFNKAIRR